jgi:uncharacterized membrane protein YbhN (UPF0104 family)
LQAKSFLYRVNGQGKYFRFILKATLLAIVLWLLLGHLNLPALRAALALFSPRAVMGVCSCMALRLAVQAWRMYYAAQATGIPARYATLLRWEIEILFLELSLPLPDAEDMFRTLLWQKWNSGVSRILSALLFSRLCGIIVLSAVLPFALISPNKDVTKAIPLYAVCLLPLILVAMAFALKKILHAIAAVLPKIKFIPQRITAVLVQMAAVDTPPHQWIAACALAFIQLSFTAAGIYVLAQSVGVPVSYLQLLVFTPLLILAFTLPLSIQGLGLPEAAMVWLLIHSGVKAETAAAIGLVHFACYALFIVAGTVSILLFSKNKLTEIKKAILRLKNNNPLQNKSTVHERTNQPTS